MQKLLMICGLLLAGSTQAAVVSVRTGVDNLGAVLAAGSIDPNWTISTNGSDFSSARVAYPGSYPNYNSGQICCGMETISADAAWITTPSVLPTSPTTGWGISNTVYARTEFDLSDFDLSSVSLNGLWRVADVATGIYLNGNLLAGTATYGYAFSSSLPFSVAAGSSFFVSGINRLELRGYSVNNVWDGFWVAADVKGDLAPVPVPGAFGLMLGGLLMLVKLKRT